MASNADGWATSSPPPDLTILTLPTVPTHPSDQVAVVGGIVRLDAVGDGTPPLHYQWRKNGADIPSATNATLSLIGLSADDAGAYSVVVSNIVGSASSPPSVLTVLTNVAIGTLISDQTWTLAASPFFVHANITVSNLVVEAGVSILLDKDCEFKVVGRLTAQGTDDRMIRFQAAQAGMPHSGVHFVNADTNSVMAYCWIEGSRSGGLRLEGTAMSLRNLVVINNAGYRGGGIGTDSPIAIEDCVIEGNRVFGSGCWGGGFSSTGARVSIRHCRISGNVSRHEGGSLDDWSSGGGIYISPGGTNEIVDSEIAGNNVTGVWHPSPAARGGGMYLGGNSTLDRVKIVGNSAYATGTGFGVRGYGGGVFVNGTCNMSHTSIIGNSAYGDNGGNGGGVYALSVGTINMINCIVAQNSSTSIHGTGYDGAGMQVACGGLIRNCTFYGNNQFAVVGFLGAIHNSILHGNKWGQISGSSPVVSYSDIQGGYAGANNIDLPPIFSNDTNYSTVDTYLMLAPNSPAIDSGDSNPDYNDDSFPPSLGSARNDMGAFGGPQSGGWDSFNLRILQCIYEPGRVKVLVPTSSGRTYVLEFKESLMGPDWTALPQVSGTGLTLPLIDNAPGTATRFYRVRRF